MIQKVCHLIKKYSKIYLDENELSAIKIIKVWESLAEKNDNLSQPNNWIKFKIFHSYEI